MVAQTQTFAFAGIEAIAVAVQVKITSGNPSFTIVGLPDKAVGESKERVRAAISSTGLSWPFQKITVNLAPADLQKEGGHFDLAIALGIMIEIGVLAQELIKNYFIIGELGLDGSVHTVGGVISSAITANQRGCGLICPQKNGREAVWSGNPQIIATSSIIELINHLKGEQIIARPDLVNITDEVENEKYPDLIDVKGQEIAKRALEIAGAGGHNLLMVGPPGTGKSMLASRLSGILPPLELMEVLEINMIASMSDKIIEGKLLTKRPFREVHHSCSMPAMVGGGVRAKPGEVSLAHRGVLFLDELAEFPRQVLDSLRQPLETGFINISRVNSHITYPANFQLICAMNPCRCGYLGDTARECKKAPHCAEEYKSRISGPLLDRIDIVINVGWVDYFDNQKSNQEESQIIRQRVIRARELQYQRYKVDKSQEFFCSTNAEVDGKIIEPFCLLDENLKKILQEFADKKKLSMRGISRILRVARTIADLENIEEITKIHLLEAIGFRRNL
jgi:magnesium chelatase family protein